MNVWCILNTCVVQIRCIFEVFLFISIACLDYFDCLCDVFDHVSFKNMHFRIEYNFSFLAILWHVLIHVCCIIVVYWMYECPQWCGQSSEQMHQVIFDLFVWFAFDVFVDSCLCGRWRTCNWRCERTQYQVFQMLPLYRRYIWTHNNQRAPDLLFMLFIVYGPRCRCHLPAAQ